MGDQSGQQTNPNESTDFLPAQYSVNGQALHYDPSNTAGSCYPVSANCVAGGIPNAAGQPTAGTVLIPASGAVNNQTFLTRYYGGKLAACSDPLYGSVGGVNAPNGGCGWTNGIQYYGDDMDTHYNALQATITKNMSHGYSLNISYAWQKAISEATSYSTWNRAVVRGRDGALRQQQIIVYGLLQLPFGNKKMFLNHTNRIVNQAVSGWEISPVISYASGLPYTLSYNNCSASNVGAAPCYVSGNVNAFHSHPKGLPGQNLTFYDAFSSNAAGNVFTSPGQGTFTAPGLDQIGNVGRNTAFGPHNFNTDLSVQKNFPIRESVSFQLRADGFNAFNHINWGTPNGNIQNGGAIGSGPLPNGSSNPRQLQFSGRVQF